MNYMGLNICKDEEIKYYKNFFKSQIIEINHDVIARIDSVQIDSSVIMIEYIDSISSVRVHTESSVNIFFLAENSNSVSSLKKVFSSIEYIHIDKYIDGNTINNNFIRNKSKPKLYTENIFCTKINNNTILLTYYNIIDLKINPSFYISYYMENGISNNIFISYSNGNNLTQKTFDNFFTYDNIIYDSQTSKLVFLGHNNNLSQIYYTDARDKSQSKLNCIDNFKTVESFCFYNKNKLLISLQNDSSFYTYDLNKKEIIKLPIFSITSNFSKVTYDNKSNRIYFISYINNNPLCSLDKNFHLEIIHNEYVVDYAIDSVSQKILVKSIVNGNEVLYILYGGLNGSSQIHFDFKYDKIIKFDFFYEDHLEHIIILYEENNYNYLIKYSLTTLTYYHICASYYVNDFDIDSHTNNIFVCYKDGQFFKVVKLYKDIEYNILHTTSNIKNIFLKR